MITLGLLLVLLIAGVFVIVVGACIALVKLALIMGNVFVTVAIAAICSACCITLAKKLVTVIKVTFEK